MILTLSRSPNSVRFDALPLLSLLVENQSCLNPQQTKRALTRCRLNDQIAQAAGRWRFQHVCAPNDVKKRRQPIRVVGNLLPSLSLKLSCEIVQLCVIR